MARDPGLAQSQLFQGLAPEQLEVVRERMRPREFTPGEQLCAAGDPSDRIWLITAGLVNWRAGTTAGAGEIELRMRKGDVIGAQDAITGAERTATVAASTITQTLELDASDLLELAARFPQILINVVQTQRERLFRASARSAALFSASVRSSSQRGEEIGVISGPSLKSVLPRLVAAARTASPRPVSVLDRSLSFAGALTASDELATEHDTVLIPSELDPDTLGVLLDEVDRVVALVGTAEEAAEMGRVAAAAEGRRLEIVVVSDEAREASQMSYSGALELVVRDCPRQAGFPLADRAWPGSPITSPGPSSVRVRRGGAKGYAHVGFLQTLEEAGYAVDYVGGSSIGGFVASQSRLAATRPRSRRASARRSAPRTSRSCSSRPWSGPPGSRRSPACSSRPPGRRSSRTPRSPW